MGIVAFIILGLIAGVVVSALMPGPDPGGMLVTGVVGVAGALLGGFLAGALLGADPLGEFFDVSTWLAAVGGSLVVLVLYRLVAGDRRQAGTPT